MSASVVVVTGALTGIGEATASAFAQGGNTVVVSGRHDDVGEQLARDLKRAGSPDNQNAAAATIPQRRAGQPEEVADTIVFMAGTQATYLTGQTLFLDGGVTAS
jgi:NAD(P)-dependent dehydrogenase (short-subunit alcohol dehydrogenase family)